MTHSDVLGAPATSPSAYSPYSDRHPAPESTIAEWTALQRVLFRFGIAYVLLYCYPSPLDEIPYVEIIGKPYEAFWHAVVPWFGAHVLQLSRPVSLQPSGSSDKMFDWVQIAAMLVLAALIAAVWTMVDRRRKSYTKLAAAFRIFLRFKMAGTLFSYGFDKVIPNQFEPVNPVRLTQYIGEAAPGGFAWSFLGFSLAYEVFAGLSELIAGCLLLFRRTSTLGAILGVAVLTNVFMLNMSFDIPVKQYSFHLLLMCVVLVAYDANRLIDVFIRQRGVAPQRFVELFTTRRSLVAARVVGALFGACMFTVHFYLENQWWHEGGRLAPKVPLYGIFEVERVVKNGVEQPPLLTDATRWRRLAVTNYKSTVRLATDSLVPVSVKTDSVKHIATIAPVRDSSNAFRAAYVFPDPTHLVLRGRQGADSIEMTFLRRREDSYLLVGRGFHMVNEVPYFR